MTAVCGQDDEARLRAVRRYELLDGAPDPELDRIVVLAASTCRAPLAFLAWDAPVVADGLLVLASQPVVTPDGYRIGSLCVADRAHRELSAGEADTLRRLAEVAMDLLELRLRARRNEETVDQLQQGMLSNREIGKALGLMMARYQLDDEEAFAKLRDHSRDLNMKLRLLAAEIVAHHNRGTAAERSG